MSDLPADRRRWPAAAPGHVWWKHGVIYQVYPRSFQDSNADGVGDLNGLIGRLDYLLDLGVEAIWLSPIYQSPMKDFGYDVRDHVAVDPLFGDLTTFDTLVRAVHARGLKLVMDYIPNHTSDDHLWFQESRGRRENPRRDWYIWRDPAPDGGPPNNWRSEFGGPAWTFDPATRQFYYHAFLPSQPDLNWRNPDVVQAMLNVLGFWLDRGVDGVRVDAIHHLIEDEALSDNPPNPDWTAALPPAEALFRRYTVDQPEVHAAVTRMRARADSYGADRALIGEAYLPLERLVAYYGGDGDGFHLPFNFHLMSTPWTPVALADLVARYEAQLPAYGWPNWVLGNHDRSRLASRVGTDQTRVAAMLLLTLRGTPTLYQGDELGLLDVFIPPDRVRDPWELNLPGRGLGRDPVRTPMPWSGDANAGFTDGQPWLPLNSDWPDNNVAAQRADPRSLLNLYRDLLSLRRARPALTHGAYVPAPCSGRLLVYERREGNERLVVVLNLTGAPETWALAGALPVLSTLGPDRVEALNGGGEIAAHEGVIFGVASPAP
jgi:alpha-glucosidase